MKKLVLFLFLAGVWGAGLAGAQDNNEKKVKVGSVAPDIEAKDWLNAEAKPPSLAEMRGMVVVLYFWVSFHQGGDAVMPMLVEMQHQALFGQTPGLMVIGITDADRKQVEDSLTSHKIQFPVAVGSEAYREYEIDSFPYVVVIDPEGKVAYRGAVGGGEFMKEMTDLYGKIPPWKTHPVEVTECHNIMDETRDLLKQKNYADAYTAITNGITRAVIGDKLKMEMQVYVDLIEQLAYDRLAAVNPLVEQKKYKEAYAVIRTVQRQFKRTPAGRDALELNERLKKRIDDYRLVAGSSEDEDAAAKLLAQAREDIAGRKFGPGYEKLKDITGRYAFSESADNAQQIIARMEKNKNVMAAVAEFRSGPECEKMLSEARNLIASKRYKEARELLNKILNSYSNTKYAEDALTELKRLP